MPFILGFICLPMIALSDLLQGMSRANSWALFALSPTYLVRPVLILVFMAAALVAGYRARRRDGASSRRSWRHLCDHASRSSSASPAASTARSRPARATSISATWFAGVAADLPGRELLLPAHQCRRADGRLLHAARRRRHLFRHGEDAGAGAFRLFRRQGGRRAALRRLHAWRPGRAWPPSRARPCRGRSGRRC